MRPDRAAVRVVSLLSLILPAASAHAGDAPRVTPYGFVRLDAIYDDSRLSNPQFPSWVDSETPANRDDQELSIHPRLTRLGMRLEPVDAGHGVTASGQVEVDFQNGGSESRQALRMRQGYVQFATRRVELLAGQTWDLVAPLWPAANNDALMWNAGNPGDRRPQLRATFRPRVGGAKVRLAAALGQPNAINAQDLDGNGQLDGLDAAVPTMQALAEVERGPVRAGVWGHLAKDRVDVAGNRHDFTGALAGGHLRVAPGRRFSLQGEGFWGQDASDVRAGIGQSINLALDRAIETRGGWAEAALRVSPAWTVTAGGSIDQPHASDLPDGGRRQNSTVYLVQHLRPWSGTTFGLEYVRWNTLYVNRPAGRANRFDAHVSYAF